MKMTMEKIDTNKLIRDDLDNTLKANTEACMRRIKNRNALFLGGFRNRAIFKLYEDDADLYELTSKFINFLVKTECSSKRLIQNAKHAHYTNDRDIQKYHYHLMERDLLGYELTDDEEGDCGIHFAENNEDETDKNMTDNEKYLHHVKLMYEQAKINLQVQYPEYDLNTEEGITALYMSLYEKLADNTIQFAVDMQCISDINSFIDQHNILAENEPAWGDINEDLKKYNYEKDTEI